MVARARESKQISPPGPAVAAHVPSGVHGSSSSRTHDGSCSAAVKPPLPPIWPVPPVPGMPGLLLEQASNNRLMAAPHQIVPSDFTDFTVSNGSKAHARHDLAGLPRIPQREP